MTKMSSGSRSDVRIGLSDLLHTEGMLLGLEKKDGYILGGLLLCKLAVALVVLLGGCCLSFNYEGTCSLGWHWLEWGSWKSRLLGWDGSYYIQLCQEGYRHGSSSCAFYPLWPAVLWVGSFLTRGSVLVVGLVLSNLLSLAGLWLFGRMVWDQYGQQTSRYALYWILACPGALFFCLPYTESLFFFLVMVVFWALHKERWGLLCIAAFLLPLTRAVGVFILLPLAWSLWENKRNRRQWLILLAPLAGYALYFAILYLFTGNAGEGFLAQKHYPRSPSIANMANWVGLGKSFLEIGSMHGMLDSLLDRVFFIFLVAMLPFLWKTNRTWFFYTLPMGVIPALSNWFMSYRRYILICFPIFIFLAMKMEKSRNRWLYWYYILFLAILQIWAILRAVNYRWAG